MAGEEHQKCDDASRESQGRKPYGIQPRPYFLTDNHAEAACGDYQRQKGEEKQGGTPPRSRGQRCVAAVGKELPCGAYQFASVWQYCPGITFRHNHRNEHFLVGTQFIIKSRTQRKIYTELIPGIVAVERTHLLAECAVRDSVGEMDFTAHRLVESCRDAGGAVVFDVIVTVNAVLGQSFCPEHRPEPTRLFLCQIQLLFQHFSASLGVFGQKPCRRITADHIVRLSLYETVHKIRLIEIEQSVIPYRIGAMGRGNIADSQRAVAAQFIYLAARPCRKQAYNEGIPLFGRLCGRTEEQD